MNPYGFTIAKDRSGRLDMVEEPHLGKLMQKIKGIAKPIDQRLAYETPTSGTPTKSTSNSKGE